ncbi:hypothetical protein [Spirosoma spitsbergense]|uniref:hypothetical protein n=1 Tax=Spirosoma spitsbergense TaxID=431554 RepID=UPI0012FC285F|nr:hypothetical protein [Spirosoma spitsbergense]
MKKVSLILALVFGFAATSFAQYGAAKCAWNMESAPYNSNQTIIQFTNIVLLGISDSEGEPVYSVALTANFGTGKASNVVLTESKSGKKWLMNQVSPGGKPLPTPCNSGQGATFSDALVYRSSMTNVSVYVSVRDNGKAVYVFAHKPMDTKLKL